MPTPFPGMDPYLERASLWPNVHNSLIIALRDDLAPRLRPRYYVAVEERVVRLSAEDVAFTVRPDVAIVEPPARQAAATGWRRQASTAGAVVVELPMLDEVHETYLELRDATTDQVVTVIELLSPVNKLPGDGRRQYEQKRINLLATLTHLVEIDLLRTGQPMTMRGFQGQSDYRILISRAERRPQADLLPFGVRDRIPLFQMPLQSGDSEPTVDLNELLHALYVPAGYDLRIDYRADAEPPLSGADAAWVDTMLRDAGVRQGRKTT